MKPEDTWPARNGLVWVVGVIRKYEVVMKLSMPRTWPRATRLGLIIGISIVALVGLILAPRVPLGPHYHDFADRRTMFGIPNAQDVLSNIPFVIVGVWGFVWLLGKSSRAAFLDQRERIPYQLFFLGVALTGVGSFWYHLAPSDFRLPWDLLPMTCSFLSIVVAMFMERVNTGLSGWFDSSFIAGRRERRILVFLRDARSWQLQILSIRAIFLSGTLCVDHCLVSASLHGHALPGAGLLPICVGKAFGVL